MMTPALDAYAIAYTDWSQHLGHEAEKQLVAITTTLGDVRVTPVAVPGHTAGAMGFIFGVKDAGRTHTAALFGGTWLTPNLLSDDAMQTYLRSVAHFREAANGAKVDVWLQNHPLMVPFQDWVTAVTTRKSGEPNPFVVGPAEYQKFLDVMQGCSEVNLARRRL